MQHSFFALAYLCLLNVIAVSSFILIGLRFGTDKPTLIYSPAYLRQFVAFLIPTFIPGFKRHKKAPGFTGSFFIIIHY